MNGKYTFREMCFDAKRNLHQLLLRLQVLQEYRTITRFFQAHHASSSGPFGVNENVINTFVKRCVVISFYFQLNRPAVSHSVSDSP